MTSNISTLVPASYYQSTTLPELFFAVVYWYKNVNEALVYDFGKYYVGCTFNEKHRRECWNSYPSAYAGAKIDAARKRTPQDKWEYDRIFLWSISLEHLKKTLSIYETHFIDYYDSFKNGFNGNRGGRGIAAWALFLVTDTSGAQEIVESYEAVASQYKVAIGSIHYCSKKKGNHIAKNGVQIKRLN